MIQVAESMMELVVVRGANGGIKAGGDGGVRLVGSRNGRGLILGGIGGLRSDVFDRG